MDIFNNQERNGVQIQVKPLDKKGKSKSFTIHNADTDEVFNRIFFLFEQLSKSNGTITIIHYKDKEEKTNDEPRID